MAQDTERLVLQMSADLRGFEREMARTRTVTERRMREVEQRAMQADRNLSRIMQQTGRNMTDGLRQGLAALAPTLAAAFSTQAVIKYSDAYTSLQARLMATGLAGRELKAVEDQLFAAANRNGVAIDAVAQMYQRVAQSQKSLGATQGEVLRLTDGVTAALRVQGVSAQQASGPLLQLGQALGAGTVRAEELNSLLEGTPLILQAAANGSSRFQGDIARLSSEIRSGTVTSQEFFRALLTGLPALEKQAENLPRTVGQAFQILDNQLGRFIGQTDQALSATQRLAAGIVLVAENLDDVRDAVVIVGTIIGTALAARALGSAIVSFTAFRAQLALTNAQLMAVTLQSGIAAGGINRLSVAGGVATASMRGLSAAMAFFGGPIGLAITALAGTLAVLAVNAGKAERATESLTARLEAEAKAADAAANEAAQLRGELTATQTWTASLTGETHKLADAHYAAAAAAKAQAIEQAKLRVETAQTDLQEARKLYDRRRLNERLAGGDGPINSAGARQAADSRLVASQEFRNLTSATTQTSLAVRQLANIMNAPLTVATGGGSGGGGGTGTGGGGRGGAAGAISDEARKVDHLRSEVERLSYDLLTDTEKAAVDLAKVRDTLRQAVAAGLLSQRDANVLEGGFAAQNLSLGDPINVQPLGNEGREIADAIAEGLRAQQAVFDEQGRNMARNFVDVLASGNIWEAAGYKFREAAFNSLEDLLSGVFSSLFQNKASGGTDFLGSLLSGFAKRATGGPVMAGQPYIVGERRPEVFVPSVSGTVIPSVNAAMARAGQASAARSQPIVVKVIGEEGAAFVPRVQALSGQVAVQTTATGVAYSQDQMRASSRRRRQSLVG